MKAFHSAKLAIPLLAASMVACQGGTSNATSVVHDALSSNGVNANLSMQSDWGSGYCTDVTLTNTSTFPVTNWTLGVELNQSTLTQIWGASSTQSGTLLDVTPLEESARIAPGASVSFGFCGNATGGNYHPTLTSLSVTGGESRFLSHASSRLSSVSLPLSSVTEILFRDSFLLFAYLSAICTLPKP